MGGNALKNTFTRRYNTQEFEELSIEMKAKIKEAFNSIPYVLQYYKNKPDHGDMDILLIADSNRGNIKKTIENTFKPNEILINDGVHSFDYKEFQIDLMPQYSFNWLSALTYFDFDPTGNLMGKIAHKFDLRYGHNGLIYKYRNKNNKAVSDMIISKDPSKIFQFLGFDYDTYMNGFNTLEEIFEYIINSKYFVPETFHMENLTAVDRKRNKKRSTYQQFLQYVNSKEMPEHILNRKFENKENYFEYIKSYFPESKLDLRLKLFKDKEDMYDNVYAKFNANLIKSKYPQFDDTSLGEVIRKFRNSESYFEKYVLETNEADMWKQFELINNIK